MPYKDKKRQNAYQTERRHAKREEAIDRLGRYCRLCLQQGPSPFFGFHHMDPSTKKFSLQASAFARSWSVLQAEIDKCVLLCHCCHALLHTRR